MIPLSCVNCSHNPLQLGPVGSAIGYCTRHRVALLAPEETTCGQLLRKDLVREEAVRERTVHERTFSTKGVRTIHAAEQSEDRLISSDLDGAAKDAVVDEVRDYGRVNSKFSGLKAMHRISGTRAEISWLSLGRGYFANCYARDRRWTAGIHLLWWALKDIARTPDVELSDLRQPVGLPIVEFFDLARWHVVAARLMLIGDIAETAPAQTNGVRTLPDLVGTVLAHSEAGSGRSLLTQIDQRAARFQKALSEPHYRQLAEKLHRTEDEES